MAEFLDLYQLNEPGDRDPRQVLHPMRLQIQPELFGPCLTNMHSKGEYEPKVEEAILNQSVVKHGPFQWCQYPPNQSLRVKQNADLALQGICKIPNTLPVVFYSEIGKTLEECV